VTPPAVVLSAGLLLLAVACARPEGRPASTTVVVPTAQGDSTVDPASPSREAASESSPGTSPSPSEGSRAESLFREAREAMSQGRLDDACGLFARSLELDVAIGTLLNLATCAEKAGDIVRACQLFEDARNLAQNKGQPDRARFAQARLTSLHCP
jgi:hypothetical protein